MRCACSEICFCHTLTYSLYLCGHRYCVSQEVYHTILIPVIIHLIVHSPPLDCLLLQASPSPLTPTCKRVMRAIPNVTLFPCSSHAFDTRCWTLLWPTGLTPTPGPPHVLLEQTARPPTHENFSRLRSPRRNMASQQVCEFRRKEFSAVS